MSNNSLKENKNILEKRREIFQSLLEKFGVDACIIENPIDLFYFLGLELSVGKLLFLKQDCYLFVDSRYLAKAKKESGLKVSLFQSKEYFAALKGVKKLGFDATKTPYSLFLELEKDLKKVSMRSEGQCVALKSPTEWMRSIKSEDERKALRKSAALLWRGYEFILQKLKAKITEKEIAKQFEIFVLSHGADGLAFEPIIAFGKNSAYPHHRASNTGLKKGDIVLIDIGVVVDHYHSDMTRVHFFKGADPSLKKMLSIVQKAQREALSICKPGIPAGELDKLARKVMKKEKMEKYFLHSLGHGIGLETHEYPRIRFDGKDKEALLLPGMAITIEPGLYIAGKGGVRYEDTVIITENSYENLFPS